MIKIYFDNTLINEESYTKLNNSFKQYTNNFNLGSTSANKFDISIIKSYVNTLPNSIKILENENELANLHIDSYTETTNEYELTLTDAMTLFNFYYDASEIFVNGQTTLLAIAQDICSKVGIQLATNNFRGYSKIITWYDNTKTARDYLGYISELNGGYAQIGHDGKLYFKKQNTLSFKTIDINECEEFNIKEKHQITRVVFEQGTLKYEFGDSTGDTLYLNGENVYITEESEVQDIYNEINGFTFYAIDCGKTPIDSSILSGDIITFKNGNELYPTIACYDIEYYGSWTGGYSLENMQSEVVQETQNIGINEKVKSINIKVDRANNQISSLVEKVDPIANTYEELQTSVKTLQTDTYSKIQVQEIVKGTGKDAEGNELPTVESMINVSATFDKNGMTFDKQDAPTKTVINYSGLTVDDADDKELLFAGVDDDESSLTYGSSIVRTKNIKTNNYYQVGNNVRIAPYKNGVGIFIL